MAIRRAKKKANVVNDKRIKMCLQRYDTHAYTRLQFLQAVSHSNSSYTDDMCDAADNSSSGDDEQSDVQDQQNDTASTSATTDTDVFALVHNCEVCLVAAKDPNIALVPCGHSRFCGEVNN